MRHYPDDLRAMLKKITASLAYRLPAVYKQLLRYKKCRAQIPEQNPSLVILMMTGKQYLTMTRLALISIVKSWQSIPSLIIMSDGSISTDRISKALNFWPGKISVETWGDTAAYHLQKNRLALVQYGNIHPFGKKLAAILRYAAQGPVMWIDSDILFFNDLTPFIPQAPGGFFCGGTEDFTAAYHEPVLKFYNNDIYRLYKFNAGLLYVHGDRIYEDFRLEQLIASIHPDYDFCTEQTIFAHIASTSAGLLWTRDMIKTFNNDNQQIRAMPVNKVVARHYTSNVRHLFWRDAFFRL